MHHFIIDIETLGLETDAPVASIACTPIDFAKHEAYSTYVNTTFSLKLDWQKQIRDKTHKPDESTMAWWAKQSDEARRYIQPLPSDVTLKDGLKFLNDFLTNHHGFTKDSWICSRGMAFDFAILDRNYRLYNIKPAIPYNKQRDIRTMIDCLQGSNNGYYEAKAKLDEPCIKHVALYDAAYDAFALSELIESLR